MKRIHLISGPRNLSTALMYSFGNRQDTSIIDEPFYAHYLTTNDVDHPGQEETLSSMSVDFETILHQICEQYYSTDYLFIKNMAHHIHNVDISFINNLTNLFLIRNPKQLIASFAKVISNPTLLDIGLKVEHDIFQYCTSRGATPLVLDSGELLKNPEKILKELCNRLEIPFSKNMLAWEAGPRKEDGVWGKYWYQSVWKSTGFKKQKSSDRELPQHLYPLYQEADYFYKKLFHHSIKA